MSSVDLQERVGPRQDSLGLSLFVFHLGVGVYVLTGWLIESDLLLTFYMMLLPAMATQWTINRGSCVLNNLESWLRTGRWRDPENREEAAFLLMLCLWLFPVRPDRALLDRVSYIAVAILWLLALVHFSWLSSSA